MKFTSQPNFLWALPWIVVTIIVVCSSFGFGLFNTYMSGNDGYDYADLGIHLIHGIGNYWSPEFTSTRFIHFYEHPPVGIWYFALFFKLFGVHGYTDKIIAFVNTAWTITITLYFWRREFPYVSKWLAWIPILLLFSNLFVTFYFAANKLECIEIPLSMTLLYWLTQSRYRQVRLSTLFCQAIIAGPICVIGFEINGMLFLYVWVAFILCRLTASNISWMQAILLTLTLVVSSLVCYGLLMGLIPAARYNNWMYWSTQLKPALLGQRTDSGHIYQGIRHIVPLSSYLYYIAGQVLATLAVWFSLEWFGLKHFFQPIKTHHHTKPDHLLFYVLLCVITSLPLLISSKDLSYYNLHTNTYLALLLSCIVTPLCHQWSLQAPFNKKVYAFWAFMALVVPFMNWLQINHIKHIVKENQIYEAYLASSTIIHQHLIPKHSTISMPPHILTHGLTYTEPALARFLDSGLLSGYDCKYLLTSIYDIIPVPKAYHLIPINLGELALYERAHALPSCHPRVESKQEYYNFGLPAPFPI